MLLAAVKQKEVDERVTLDDARTLVGIVDKLIKQRKDSIAAFQQAARTDLVDKETAEVRVLEAYLPQRLSADEIAAAGAGAGGGTRRRRGPGRHGQGDGRGQAAPGRPGRHGPGVGRRQAGLVEVE